MQTYDNQYNQDIGIPLHHGSTTEAMICENNTSIAQFQVKNVVKLVNVLPDPNLIGRSQECRPILSVVMQLGAEKPDGQRVEIKTTAKGGEGPARNTRSASKSLPDNVDRRHYFIVLYGCTSDTYSCIGENGTRYLQLLRAPDLFTDFP